MSHPSPLPHGSAHPEGALVDKPGVSRETFSWTRWTAWALGCWLSSACVDTTGPPFPHIELTEFAPSLGIDLSEMTRIDGGIYLLDLAIGSGATIPASSIDHVEVGYTSYLADGTALEVGDLSYRRGCRQVDPPGLEVGIDGMKVGGRRRIIIPGRWGYGLDPPARIDVPFGAILVFEVEARRTRPVQRC